MKVIKPIEVGPGNFQSDAPGDGHATWQTQGRNTLDGLNDLAIDVHGGEIWVIETGDKSGGDPIYRFDIATGDELVTPGSQPAAKGLDISVSPNGLWLAVGRTLPLSDYGVYVYEISSGNLLYSRKDVNVFLQGWTNNSSVLFIRQSKYNTNYTGFVGVLTSGWTESLGTNLEAFSNAGSTPVSHAGVFGIVGTKIYYLYYIYNSGSNPNRSYGWRTFDPIASSNSGGSFAETNNAYAGPSRSIYIPSRNQFLCYLGLTARLEAVDLNFNIVNARPSGLSGLGVDSITIDPAGDVVVEVNASPYYRKYAASNFNFIENLGANYELMKGQLHFEGDNVITLARSGGGYKILDTIGGQFLEQSNPSVTTGDIYTYSDHNYEALTDNNDRPDEGVVSDPPTWLDLGAINPLRMFDQSISSSTTSPETLVVQVQTNSVPKAVGLFNVKADTVRVQLLDQNGAQQFDTGELDMVDNTSIQDLNAYFFDGVTLSPDFVYTALPPYLGATVVVTLTPLNGEVSVGEMVVGDVHYLGDTEFGTGVGILDFSRKERDQFGNFQIIQRNFSKRASYNVSTPTGLVSSVQQKLAEYRSIPAVFIGAEERPETVVYGFYRSFDIVLDGPKFSSCNIEVEGLT